MSVVDPVNPVPIIEKVISAAEDDILAGTTVEFAFTKEREQLISNISNTKTTANY